MKLEIQKQLRQHFLDMQGYVSAGMESDKTADKTFLNANENPFELPGLEGFNRYPEPQPKALLDAYGKLYNVTSDNIAATRGADEAIVILTKLFCEPHQDKILICPPTFGMYGVNAESCPADIHEVTLIKDDSTFKLNVEQIVTQAQKLIFLCSPNNPTGTSFAKADILEILERTKKRSIVVLDETYIEFAKAQSFTSYLQDYPHLMILRTLSKSYSLAGMRMGCLLNGDPDFIQLARSKAMDAYPLPKESIKAALHVVKPDIQKQAQNNIKTLLQERTKMEEALTDLSIVKTLYQSDTNFLLVEFENPKEILDACEKQNIVLRDFSNKALTQNCLRISIGTPQQNDTLLKILNTF